MGIGISRHMSYINEYTDTLSEHEIKIKDRELLNNYKNNGQKINKQKKKKSKKISLIGKKEKNTLKRSNSYNKNNRKRNISYNNIRNRQYSYDKNELKVYGDINDTFSKIYGNKKIINHKKKGNINNKNKNNNNYKKKIWNNFENINGINYKQKFMINKWDNIENNNNIYENNIEDYYNWDKTLKNRNNEYSILEDNDSKIIEISFYSSDDENNENRKQSTDKKKRNSFNPFLQKESIYHNKHWYYTNRYPQIYNYKSFLYPRLNNNYRKHFEFSNTSNEPKNISNFNISDLHRSCKNRPHLPFQINKYYNYSIKDIIYSEFQRHKKYLDPTEKKCVEEIDYSNYINCDYFRYSKSILLHQKEITSICSIKYNIRKICYATGGKDGKIKLWKQNFECIFAKINLQHPPLVLLQYQTRYLLSAEGIYIKIYDLNSNHLDLSQTLRDHIGEIKTILIVGEDYLNQTNLKIITGGKDKILRMWNVLQESVIKYFEGHRDTVTNIQYVGNYRNIIISMAIDKCFIVWEIQTSNIIIMFNNYFSSTCLLGTNFGFCCGAYDNKIRFYDKEYNMVKCIVGDFFNCDNFLMISNNHLIFTTAENELMIIDIDSDKIFSYYKGLKCDIKKMIKSFDWDMPERNMNNQLRGIKFKNILTVGTDGYVYIWECYQYINNFYPVNDFSDSSSYNSFDS